MSRGKGQSQAKAGATDDLQQEKTSEGTGEQNEATEGDTLISEATPEELVEADPYDKLEGMTTEEAVASPTGGSDQYPYLDKTSLPLDERDLPANSDAFGPSQADLNPAFALKPDDDSEPVETTVPQGERTESYQQGEPGEEGTEPLQGQGALAADAGTRPSLTEDDIAKREAAAAEEGRKAQEATQAEIAAQADREAGNTPAPSEEPAPDPADALSGPAPSDIPVEHSANVSEAYNGAGTNSDSDDKPSEESTGDQPTGDGVSVQTPVAEAK